MAKMQSFFRDKVRLRTEFFIDQLFWNAILPGGYCKMEVQCDASDLLWMDADDPGLVCGCGGCV